MDKANRYLDILKIKKYKYYQFRKNSILNYQFFRLQTFQRKLINTGQTSKKKFFKEFISDMLTGYGDFSKKTDAMQFIENLIVKFVSNLVIKVNFISFLRLSKRPVLQDILFLIRKTPFKVKRILYLIKTDENNKKLFKQNPKGRQIPKEILNKCKKKNTVIQNIPK